jgi:hypothetical protein
MRRIIAVLFVIAFTFTAIPYALSTDTAYKGFAHVCSSTNKLCAFETPLITIVCPTGMVCAGKTNTTTSTTTATGTGTFYQTPSQPVTATVTAVGGTLYGADGIQFITATSTNTATRTATATGTATGTVTQTYTNTSSATATSATLPTTITYNAPLTIVPGGDRFFGLDYDTSLTITPGFKAAPYSDVGGDYENAMQASPTVGSPAVFNSGNTLDFRALDLENPSSSYGAAFYSKAEWVPDGDIKLWLWAKSTSPAAITVDVRRCDRFTPVDTVATIGPLDITSTTMSMQYAHVTIPSGGILLIPNRQLCIRITATTTSGTPTVTLGSSTGYHTRINGPWIKVGTTTH